MDRTKKLQLAGGIALLMAGLAWPAHAGGDHWVWTPPQDEAAPAPQALNGALLLGGLTGGVGNTYGSLCCTGGGVAWYGGARRQGADEDIAFRSARDAAFGSAIGGPVSDRAFRFRANSIQRSGF